MSKEGGKINLQDKLIKACLKNDRRSQMLLYKQYAKAMYNVCLNIVHNTTDAEELMQDAFISAFSNLQTFKGEVTFGAWLKKITINKCIDYIKKKKIQFVSLDDYIELPIQETNSEAEFKKYKIEKIKTAISLLPEGYRTILSLYLFEGYDHEEIGQILDISASTSRSQYSRSKAILLKKLKES